MKTKFIMAGALALGLGSLAAQSSSDWKNNTPIGGINCAGYGYHALFSSAANDSNNVALGHKALEANNGATDNTGIGYKVLINNTTGAYNSALGSSAMFSNTTGRNNTAIGIAALYSNSSGTINVAVGDSALYNNTANGNCAFGSSALLKNSSGNNNMAFGPGALYYNTTGVGNIGVGFSALYNCTTGGGNIGIATNALAQNTSGSNNIALGAGSLSSNQTGYRNIALGGAIGACVSGFGNIGVGQYALSLTNGNNNIGIGENALGTDTSGIHNVGIGTSALANNLSGIMNSGVGQYALSGNTTGDHNSALGKSALASNTSGSGNSGLGYACDVSTGTLTNATALGSSALVNAIKKVRIGNTAVTVVEGQVAYTNPSDARFKTNISEQDVKGLEFIMKLRPVVYNFDTKKFTQFLTKNMPAERQKEYLKDDFAPSTAIRQSGFLAQEVEQAAKEVNYDFNGLHKPNDENDNYGLAYSQFVVPLVKAVQEQQNMIEQQKACIEKLQAELENQKNSNQLMQEKLMGVNGINQLDNTIPGFSMEQNLPNPFSTETVIKYTLPQAVSSAYLAVFDLSGKQVGTFAINQKGNGSVSIGADKLAAGIYLYSIVADGKALATKRMMVSQK